MFGNINIMSVVIKTVGSKRYAYMAYRSGKKVVQKYLGPVSDPRIAERIKGIESEKNVPERFYSLFWDTDPSKIDLKRNARYVIERILEMGRLDAVEWLQRIYPTRLIIETCEVSRKISERSRNFWRIWFGGVDAR